MGRPVLVVMAAGMSTRFGTPKQLTPVDGLGRCLPDYACFDAALAGFGAVVFVLRAELEAEFRRTVGARAARRMEVRYALQSLGALPEGFAPPPGRVKPWGTAHAVLCAAEAIAGRPFAVVNADDFYGRVPYAAIYDFLARDGGPNVHAMAGYRLDATLSPGGGVSRGICEVDGDGLLRAIREVKGIARRPDGAIASGRGEALRGDEVVSMNLWGFGEGFCGHLAERFGAFLRGGLSADPFGAEWHLPAAVGAMVAEGSARVRVLPARAAWHGMTFADDLPRLRGAIAALQGDYKEK